MTHTTDHYERPRSNSYSESNIIACNRGRVDLRAKSPHFARAEQVAARGIGNSYTPYIVLPPRRTRTHAYS